jgi:polysaccharide export outer membrane protein
MLGRLVRVVRQVVALALASLVAGAGTASSQPANPSGVQPVTEAAAAPAAGYRLARGDELNFRFLYTPELNMQAVVRPDGRIALPLMGDLLVEGLSVAELTDRVQRGLAEQVRRPQVVINVQGTGSQRVFIGGEVVRSGVQPLVGPLSVLQAVMAAEGLKDTAQPAEVVVLRRGPGGRTEPMRLDLRPLLAGQPGAQDLLLQPYDVVVVPRSGIANLGLWVDQYVRRVLPVSLGFSYTINRNGTLQ